MQCLNQKALRFFCNEIIHTHIDAAHKHASHIMRLKKNKNSADKASAPAKKADKVKPFSPAKQDTSADELPEMQGAGIEDIEDPRYRAGTFKALKKALSKVSYIHCKHRSLRTVADDFRCPISSASSSSKWIKEHRVFTSRSLAANA